MECRDDIDGMSQKLIKDAHQLNFQTDALRFILSLQERIIVHPKKKIEELKGEKRDIEKRVLMTRSCDVPLTQDDIFIYNLSLL